MCLRFYHLSRSRAIKGIVATTDRRRRTGEYRVPQECKVHGAEAADARICVAPTVWQCLISMTDTALLYIYSLECVDASRPLPAHNVSDATVTDEHWITDAVIEKNEGLIRLKKVGSLRSELVSGYRARIARWKDQQVSAGLRDELKGLWIVDESSEWRLRDGVGLPDKTREPHDETPLMLPRWSWN